MVWGTPIFGNTHILNEEVCTLPVHVTNAQVRLG